MNFWFERVSIFHENSLAFEIFLWVILFMSLLSQHLRYLLRKSKLIQFEKLLISRNFLVAGSVLPEYFGPNLAKNCQILLDNATSGNFPRSNLIDTSIQLI